MDMPQIIARSFDVLRNTYAAEGDLKHEQINADHCIVNFTGYPPVSGVMSKKKREKATADRFKYRQAFVAHIYSDRRMVVYEIHNIYQFFDNQNG